MASIVSRSATFLKEILSVALPFGRRKLFVVVASMLLQGALQLGGVASVLPFLSVAAHPENFANSQFGRLLMSIFHLTDARLLVYVTGVLAIVSLVIASVISHRKPGHLRALCRRPRTLVADATP